MTSLSYATLASVLDLSVKSFNFAFDVQYRAVGGSALAAER